MATEPEQPVKRNWGLWLIVAAVVVALLLFALPSLLGGPDTDEADTGAGGCALQTYRSQATPLMSELNDITDETDIRSASSRTAAQTAVTTLLGDINRLECRASYPLKHETLEFAARHFRDAMEAMDEGDNAAALESLDAAILNTQRFNDWSVDVDN